ncbi:hypothetical protein [Streptomyces maremycinicus]|uniref:hypothetical protein n=1 Tax=Streptomyces maremycinicus TaxID=1679753 RepID=UPI000AB71A12|nr:hypothetical protein [Streptomyces sp. NBRC 110468]
MPTDPRDEADRGRVARRLDPGDLRGLAEHCCCPEDASEETEERCPRLRFRARAAPHKS